MKRLLELLARLRRSALETARRWPSWEDATARMAAALEEIAAAPEPASAAGVPELLGDVHAGMEELRVEQLRLLREVERQSAEVAAERSGRELAEQRAARLEQQLAATLRARARRLLASRRR